MLSKLEQEYPLFIQQLCGRWISAENSNDWRIIASQLFGAFNLCDDFEMADDLHHLLLIVNSKY